MSLKNKEKEIIIYAHMGDHPDQTVILNQKKTIRFYVKGELILSIMVNADGKLQANHFGHIDETTWSVDENSIH